ncbi:hypothetical protein EBT31_06065 [bacterium]|nr:hypothetical protein [bacterium]
MSSRIEEAKKRAEARAGGTQPVRPTPVPAPIAIPAAEPVQEVVRAQEPAHVRPAPGPQSEAPTEPAPAAPPVNPLRQAADARAPKVDVGQYLRHGYIEHALTVLPGLVVVVRTPKAKEEREVQALLLEMVKDKPLNQYGLEQLQLALRVAAYMRQYMGTPTGATLRERLSFVEDLGQDVVALIYDNISWFADRVTKGISLEAVKNG